MIPLLLALLSGLLLGSSLTEAYARLRASRACRGARQHYVAVARAKLVWARPRPRRPLPPMWERSRPDLPLVDGSE